MTNELQKTLKHYVREFSPGAFFAEDSTREIESREAFVPKENTYMYEFHDREIITSEGKTFTGEVINISKQHFIDARILSLGDIAREHGKDSTLYHNVEGNGYSFCVQNRFRGYTGGMLKSPNEIILVSSKK